MNWYNRQKIAQVVPTEPVELIYFFAKWCPACKYQKPIIDKLERGYGDKLIVHRIDTDIEDHMETVKQFNVSSLPTTVVFKGDDHIVMKGMHSEQDIRGAIIAVQNGPDSPMPEMGQPEEAEQPL